MANTRVRAIDELKKKKKMARIRFRRVVRSVVLNRIWMAEMEDEKLTLNVKKNISTLVRTQYKIGLMTKAQKTLLRMHPSCRSVQDRKDLVKLLSGLLCFARIPPKLRARLVPVVKFLLLGPRRKVINYGDPASMVFFIISGEVEISTRVFDPLTNNYIEEPDYYASAGDCIGDIELFEGCKRLNTYTTTSDTELLIIDEDDFNAILKPYMLQKWLDLKSMIDSLQYFNYMTDQQLFMCRKLGKLSTFEPLETIYHQDKGKASFVHFVLSGECMILQCLKMMVKTRDEKKTFELVEFTQDDDIFQNITSLDLLKKRPEEKPSLTKSGIDLVISSEDITKHPLTKVTRANLKDIEILCGLREPSKEEIILEEDFSNEETAHKDIKRMAPRRLPTINTLNDLDNDSKLSSEAVSAINLGLSMSTLFTAQPSHPSEQHRNTIGKGWHKRKSLATSKIENHFIDVGSYTHGGIFGLGEKMEHRVIMARTTVHCFMLPRFWLLSAQQNPGNIWQRRRFHLDSNIPSRVTLFKDFLATRKWQKFKNDLVQSSVREFCGNPTKTQDVPVIGRIVESNDD